MTKTDVKYLQIFHDTLQFAHEHCTGKVCTYEVCAYKVLSFVHARSAQTRIAQQIVVLWTGMDLTMVNGATGKPGGSPAYPVSL